jgi:hypothetical protein
MNAQDFVTTTTKQTLGSGSQDTIGLCFDGKFVKVESQQMLQLDIEIHYLSLFLSSSLQLDFLLTYLQTLPKALVYNVQDALTLISQPSDQPEQSKCIRKTSSVLISLDLLDSRGSSVSKTENCVLSCLKSREHLQIFLGLYGDFSLI